MTTVAAELENGIGRLHIDNPPLNILTRKVLKRLRRQLTRLAPARQLRVLLVTAEGKHFSAGADVEEHLPPEHEHMIPEFIATVRALDCFPLPVIAAVRGRCLGGGFELAQAADIIVAGESAVFGQPEIALGVMPPAACALLPELCSPSAAAEIVLSGEPLDAREALGLGLVRRVVADEELEDAAMELARSIARHSGAALRATVRALRAGTTERRVRALAAARKVYMDELMETGDAIEGLQAFVEKREPSWSHR